jgi:hypothetical protein
MELPGSSGLLPASLVFADTPSRIVAYLLDGLLIGAANAVPFTALGLFSFRYDAFPDRTAFALGSIIGYAIQLVYLAWFWSGGRRATPGQRVLSIQVANAFDGRPLTPAQTVKRVIGFGTWIGLPVLLPYRGLAVVAGVVSVIWAIVLFVSVVTSPTRQGLHDRWAGSALVRPAEADRTWPRRIVWLVVLLSLLYVLLFGCIFVAAPREALPTDFWDRYLQWLWPA